MIARRSLFSGLIAATAIAAVAPALAQEYPRGYAPMPEPRREEVPPPPRGRRVVWEPGHWQWDGRRYVWRAGHYISAHPRPREWVNGAWVARGPRWVWVPGHWQ